MILLLPPWKRQIPTLFRVDGQSSVAFGGQTTRIGMATELVDAMKNFDGTTAPLLLEMYRNEGVGGSDVDPFSETALNASDKSVRSKVASSRDFFSDNTTEGVLIKDQFETWLQAQVAEVFPQEEVAAAPGTAGQIADGTTPRYVNALGLEYDQLVNKGLIGALMVDQMLNNYLSTSVLDEGSHREDHEAGTLEAGKNYTTLEHKWDEAYGYAYGQAADGANPNATVGDDDGFLNKYIGRVEDDPDFAGIAEDIFDAFALGRAAIVAQNYELRDQQAAILREKISEIIGIRAVYYLQQGKLAIDQANPDYGTAFHELSEGYGFIYSLRFTRQPGTDASYFSRTEVDELLQDLLSDGPNGLWEVTPETLDTISEVIASRFNFSVAQAGSKRLITHTDEKISGCHHLFRFRGCL